MIDLIHPHDWASTLVAEGEAGRQAGHLPPEPLVKLTKLLPSISTTQISNGPTLLGPEAKAILMPSGAGLPQCCQADDQYGPIVHDVAPCK